MFENQMIRIISPILVTSGIISLILATSEIIFPVLVTCIF